jgi:hypothetical protein
MPCGYDVLGAPESPRSIINPDDDDSSRWVIRYEHVKDTESLTWSTNTVEAPPMTNEREGKEREVYEIRVKGVINGKWSEWFEGLKVSPQPSGETILTGPLVDQAALHGLLQKIRDLGLPLISVKRAGMEDSSGPQRGGE